MRSMEFYIFMAAYLWLVSTLQRYLSEKSGKDMENLENERKD